MEHPFIEKWFRLRSQDANVYFPLGPKFAIGVQKRKNNDIRRREVIAM